jgi:hypothetical protein
MITERGRRWAARGLTRRTQSSRRFFRRVGARGWPRNDTDDHGKKVDGVVLVLVLSAAVLVLSAAVLVLSAAVLVLSAAVLVLSAAVLVLSAAVLVLIAAVLDSVSNRGQSRD